MEKKKLPLAFWIFIGLIVGLAGGLGLMAMGLPVAGVGLVMGVDRIFDMGRTTINITGDAACAVIVSRLEDRKRRKSQA